MTLKRNKIFLFLFSACLTGYTWLFFQYTNPPSQGSGICMLKHTTGIPCPSCGSTRAVLSILNGDLLQALYWNPLGFILFLFLLVSPIWIMVDLIRNDDSLLRIYIQAELLFRQKKIALPSIALIILNWFWNIQKGL